MQLELDWSTPAARVTDPTTSQQAATANPVARSKQRLQVLQALELLGPVTDCTLSHYLGILRGSAAKRRGELVTAGMVERVGRSTTDTGAAAFTWAITPLGRQVLEEVAP